MVGSIAKREYKKLTIVGSYPSNSIPPSSFTYNGVNFSFPVYKAAGNDNVLAQGQTVNVPRGRYFSVSMLAAGETGLAAGFVNASYADGSNSSGQVLVPSWWSWPYPFGGDLVFPHYLTNRSIDFNRSNIFQTVNWLDSNKELTSVILPNVTAGSDSGPGGSAITTRLHIFSLSLLSAEPMAASNTSKPEVQYARATNKWIEASNKTQIIEVLVNNAGPGWISGDNPLNVTVLASGLQTIKPGLVKRLAPGDQYLVQVGVQNKPGVATNTTGQITIVFSSPSGPSYHAHTFNGTFGIAPYEPTYNSIYSHESPEWYNDAKYGIFIHWGVYSVPGWGNSGKNESYAEWYDPTLIAFPILFRANLIPGIGGV
jgi:alpha-L-fucosidase